MGLDEPVETYLPGLIRLRVLTPQRSRCVSSCSTPTAYLSTPTSSWKERYLPDPDHYAQPRDLLDTALSKPAAFGRVRSGITPVRTHCLGMLIDGCLSAGGGSRSTSASSRSWVCPTYFLPRERRRFVALTLRGVPPTSTVKGKLEIIPRWIRLGGGRLVRWSRPRAGSPPSSGRLDGRLPEPGTSTR